VKPESAGKRRLKAPVELFGAVADGAYGKDSLELGIPTTVLSNFKKSLWESITAEVAVAGSRRGP